MLLLSAEASFKRVALSFESLKPASSKLITAPCRTKDRGLISLYQNFPVGIIGIYGIGSHTSYPCVHKLLRIVLQRMPSLNACRQRCSMNNYAVYLYIIDLCTELDRTSFKAPLTMGRT